MAGAMAWDQQADGDDAPLASNSAPSYTIVLLTSDEFEATGACPSDAFLLVLGDGQKVIR